ncbi:hypothetical protein BDZ91DRAFT_744627 [Kalaharituber pfeilii]|nr:hypothetical protein BDZ91DRAFT_744627 [Kalaharituber pfeilii]
MFYSLVSYVVSLLDFEEEIAFALAVFHLFRGLAYGALAGVSAVLVELGIESLLRLFQREKVEEEPDDQVIDERQHAFNGKIIVRSRKEQKRNEVLERLLVAFSFGSVYGALECFGWLGFLYWFRLACLVGTFLCLWSFVWLARNGIKIDIQWMVNMLMFCLCSSIKIGLIRSWMHFGKWPMPLK